MLVLRASIWCRAHQISSLTNFFQLLHSTKHSTKFRRLFLRADAPSPHSHLNPKPRATKCTEVPPGQRRTPGAKPLLSQRDSRMTFVVRRTPGANPLISSRNCTQRGAVEMGAAREEERGEQGGCRCGQVALATDKTTSALAAVERSGPSHAPDARRSKVRKQAAAKH